MCSFFCFIQFILSTARDDFFLMLQIIIEHLQNIHYLWLVIDQSQHDHAKCILKLCMFVQLI